MRIGGSCGRDGLPRGFNHHPNYQAAGGNATAEDSIVLAAENELLVEMLIAAKPGPETTSCSVLEGGRCRVNGPQQTPACHTSCTAQLGKKLP